MKLAGLLKASSVVLKNKANRLLESTKRDDSSYYYMGSGLNVTHFAGIGGGNDSYIYCTHGAWNVTLDASNRITHVDEWKTDKKENFFNYLNQRQLYPTKARSIEELLEMQKKEMAKITFKTFLKELWFGEKLRKERMGMK